MDMSVLKGHLHEYIENADYKGLETLSHVLEEQIGQRRNYDEATLRVLYQRRENHLNGVSKSYTMEEAFDLARKNAE